MKKIDSHVHIINLSCLDFFSNYADQCGFDGVNLACLSNSYSTNSVAHNVMALIFKTKEPRFYAHGALVYPDTYASQPIPPAYNFKRQAQAMISCGFDGIKMLEGKPTARKTTGIRLDDPVYDEFYAWAEENQIHIIMHACDPETFWDADTAPAFSADSGWCYADGTFPTKEQIYEEVRGVLQKFPNLHMTFAHFFFLSDFYDAAVNMMEKYKNISFDITPGREMYENFSKMPDKWHDFFEKYCDRIQFGTDNQSDAFQGDVTEVVSVMRRFLTTDDTFSYWDFEIKGIKLSNHAVEQICGGNFMREVGDTPKPIDIVRAKQYISDAKSLLDPNDPKLIAYVDSFLTE